MLLGTDTSIFIYSCSSILALFIVQFFIRMHRRRKKWISSALLELSQLIDWWGWWLYAVEEESAHAATLIYNSSSSSSTAKTKKAKQNRLDYYYWTEIQSVYVHHHRHPCNGCDSSKPVVKMRTMNSPSSRKTKSTAHFSHIDKHWTSCARFHICQLTPVQWGIITVSLKCEKFKLFPRKQTEEKPLRYFKKQQIQLAAHPPLCNAILFCISATRRTHKCTNRPDHLDPRR
ncbi:hypothetical protein Tsp_14890 [Trichinella spiralis]|uniref:hypothetical protein n=1 Tax=Trichinella spiralis TaxID=6334 RepID=UPI0001EFDAC5|nr:hypothetical protein Tsp_14890 [Trichinella spiralis]